jgi:hypothetical protein
MPEQIRAHSSSAAAEPSARGELLMTAAKEWNMTACSTIPASRRCASPGRATPAASAWTSSSSNRSTSGS